MDLDLQIVPALVTSEVINVTVYAPGIEEEFLKTLEMTGGEVQVFKLPADLMASGNEKARKGIRVMSTSPIGEVFGLFVFLSSKIGVFVSRSTVHARFPLPLSSVSSIILTQNKRDIQGPKVCRKGKFVYLE